MNRTLLAVLMSSLLLAAGGAIAAAAAVGKPAPDFSLSDLDGKPVKLADFKGRHVVLEWHNPHCPFVMKHYDTGNMQALQNRYDAGDVIWLTVNSTNPAHQDYLSNAQLKDYIADKKAAPDGYLTDAEGAAGMQYGARTTPHMYVIDPRGMLVYAGAIDDKRSSNKADVKDARNHVAAALEESRAGKPVTTASTSPYGCSVKYK